MEKGKEVVRSKFVRNPERGEPGLLPSNEIAYLDHPSAWVNLEIRTVIMR